MCLASEAGKMDSAVSQPDDGSFSASLQQIPTKPEIKEEGVDTDHHSPSKHTSALCPSLSCVSSTSTDAIPAQNSCQSARVKKKNKKTEEAESNDSNEIPSSTKISKTCDHLVSNIDCVFSTIEAVARGAWMDPEDKPSKKIHTSLTSGKSSLLRKKSNTKDKTFIKKKDEKLEDSSGLNGSFNVEVKGVSDINPKTETEASNTESTDLQANVVKLPHSHYSHSLAKLKEEDNEKNKERPSDAADKVNTESCGSRKSERSCKGALYKTLVSEGMLTSLRANIDRGIRFESVAKSLMQLI